jgi:NAD(P)-dependent dehydrogenase (short-subunit alcohol dehydrogenase family)
MTHVLVAGASRGIGRAVAVAFASDGAERVSVLGRSADELEQVASEVRAHGAEAQVLVADVTEVAATARAVAGAGVADVLVYAAGTNVPQPFLEVAEETYDRMFDLNVRSGFFLAQTVARAMVADGRRGAIVFISSQMGHVGGPLRTVYCSCKHAVEGLVKALALDLAPHGIRAISVAPTFVHTALTAEQLDDPKIGPALLGQIPLGRFADVDDVAAAVVWAASSGAAMVTGTSIVLDGGWTAR